MVIIPAGSEHNENDLLECDCKAEMERYPLCIFAFVLSKCVAAELYFNQLNGPRPTIPIEIQSTIHPIPSSLIILTFCYWTYQKNEHALLT